MAAIAVPFFTIPELGATQEFGKQDFTLSSSDAAMYKRVQTAGAEVTVSYQVEREAIAFAAHAALLEQYADWQPVSAHTHSRLTSEPE